MHSGLVRTRIVGSWIIHHCIVCDVHSHAIHQQRGAACVIVAFKLLVRSLITVILYDRKITTIKINYNFDYFLLDQQIIVVTQLAGGSVGGSPAYSNFCRYGAFL